jgi:CRP-like cAMP-binding protein
MVHKSTLKTLNDELRAELDVEKLTLEAIYDISIEKMMEILLRHFENRIREEDGLSSDREIKGRALEKIKDYTKKSYPFDREIPDDSMHKYVYDRLLDKWERVFDSMKEERLWDFSLKQDYDIDIENLRKKYEIMWYDGA